MERLTWRRADGAVCPRVAKGTDYHYIAGEFTQKVYDQLAVYEDAEEQGLLVRLPCKVGDTVYKVWYAPCKFGEDHPDSIGCEGCHGPCDIKKTIYEKKALTKAWIVQTFCGPGRSLVYFLTREEAEAALRGGQDDASNS